jgi:hypothetical protein
MKQLFTIAALFFALNKLTSQNIRYVTQDGKGNDGSSWKNSSNDIQIHNIILINNKI